MEKAPRHTIVYGYYEAFYNGEPLWYQRGQPLVPSDLAYHTLWEETLHEGVKAGARACYRMRKDGLVLRNWGVTEPSAVALNIQHYCKAHENPDYPFVYRRGSEAGQDTTNSFYYFVPDYCVGDQAKMGKAYAVCRQVLNDLNGAERIHMKFGFAEGAPAFKVWSPDPALAQKAYLALDKEQPKPGLHHAGISLAHLNGPQAMSFAKATLGFLTWAGIRVDGNVYDPAAQDYQLYLNRRSHVEVLQKAVARGILHDCASGLAEEYPERTAKRTDRILREQKNDLNALSFG